MLKKFVIYNFFIIIAYLLGYLLINKILYFSTYKTSTIRDIPITKMERNSVIGYVKIPRLGLQKNIYSINSTENNIDKNVTVLNKSVFPDEDNSIVFLAAHSGNNNNSYFDNLKYLKNGDLVQLNYKNNIYNYKVVKYEEVEKNGYITGKRLAQKEIILTTCSDKPTKQLIVHGIMIN